MTPLYAQRKQFHFHSNKQDVVKSRQQHNCISLYVRLNRWPITPVTFQRAWFIDFVTLKITLQIKRDARPLGNLHGSVSVLRNKHLFKIELSRVEEFGCIYTWPVPSYLELWLKGTFLGRLVIVGVKLFREGYYSPL